MKTMKMMEEATSGRRRDGIVASRAAPSDYNFRYLGSMIIPICSARELDRNHDMTLRCLILFVAEPPHYSRHLVSPYGNDPFLFLMRFEYRAVQKKSTKTSKQAVCLDDEDLPLSSFRCFGNAQESEDCGIWTTREQSLSNEDTKAADVNAAVEELLNTLSNKFAGISSEIFAKIAYVLTRLLVDEMKKRGNQIPQRALEFAQKIGVRTGLNLKARSRWTSSLGHKHIVFADFAVTD
ncbi:hypothetical protein ACRALDRAFT_1090957 [Sodiomyces alcalophilus JCM 7366]|uniref:uncharacterized protein n=1 Tax=Sodiomyces alcalophilus JCM 7366 TaxID=591952 RepID=UPI0039B46E1C